MVRMIAIQQVKNFLDSEDLPILIKLLSDPKNMKNLIAETKGVEELIEKGKQILAAKAAVEKITATNLVESARLEKGFAELEQQQNICSEASAAINIAANEIAQKNAELDKILKEAAAEKVNAEAAIEAAAKKQLEAEQKISETTSLQAELKASITDYNEAITSLKKAKVG
jgi:chromosome segregation ATPase